MGLLQSNLTQEVTNSSSIASSRPKSDDFLYFFDTICASPRQTKKQTNKKFLKKTTTNKQTDKQKLINFQLLVISLSQKRCIHKVSDVLVSHQEKKKEL